MGTSQDSSSRPRRSDSREAALDTLDLSDAWELVEKSEQDGLMYLKNPSSDQWQSVSLRPISSAEDSPIIATYRRAPYDATRVGPDPVEKQSHPEWESAAEWINAQIAD